MSLNIEWSGLDDLKKSFNQMSQNAKELEGENVVPFSELFNKEFMVEYTNYDSIQKFIDGFEPSPDVKFEDLDEKELDEFVSKNSKFKNWEEMQVKATEIYISKKLFGNI